MICCGKKNRGRRGRDHMVVGTTYAINADVESTGLAVIFSHHQVCVTASPWG